MQTPTYTIEQIRNTAECTDFYQTPEGRFLKILSVDDQADTFICLDEHSGDEFEINIHDVAKEENPMFFAITPFIIE